MTEAAAEAAERVRRQRLVIARWVAGMEQTRLEREEQDRQNEALLQRMTAALEEAEAEFEAAGAQRLSPTGTEWRWQGDILNLGVENDIRMPESVHEAIVAMWNHRRGSAREAVVDKLQRGEESARGLVSEIGDDGER